MLDLNPEKKLAGVLAPLSALRGSEDLGIGDTAALKEMITWAARHGFGTKRACWILWVHAAVSCCWLERALYIALNKWT